MATHGIARQGVGGTAAASVTQIGANIELPAGGPWQIWGLWAQAVLHTPTAAESLVGSIRIDALSGDLSPDPAPGNYPAIGLGNASGANLGAVQVPLNIWPVNWQGMGKAVISLSFVNHNGNTVAPEIACGLLFGDARPETRPLTFSDVITAAWASTAETQLGTITISEKASRIVGMLSHIEHAAALAASIEAQGIIRLDSPDVKIQPAQYPFNNNVSAGLGTPAGQASMPQMQFIPLDIPIEGGSRVNIFATSSVSVTNNARAAVYLAYE